MSSLMDDANVAVRRLVRTVLGLGENDVRPAPQRGDAGSQSTPFATVHILDLHELGTAARSTQEDGLGGLVDAVEVPVMFTASVQFYKSTPKPGYLRGAPASSTLSDYTGVTNGGFDVSIDGTNRKVTGLSFAGAADLNAVAARIQTSLAALLAGTTCIWTGKRFIMTSPTTGQTSAVGFATAPTGAGSPVDISTLLALTSVAGAVAKTNATGIADYSNDAFERARRLVLLLQLPVNAALMRSMGLGYLKPSQVRDLNGIADATWESRASVDLSFNVIARETASVNPIESADLTISAQLGGTTTTTETEVTT